MQTAQKLFGKFFISKEIDLFIKILPHKKALQSAQIITTTLQVAAFIYSTIGKCGVYNQLEKFNNDVVKVINCLSDFFLLTNNVVAILSISTSHTIVELMEYALSKNILPDTRPILFPLLIWSLRLVVFVPITINIYFIWVSIGWNMYKYYINRDVSYWFHNLLLYSFLVTAMMAKQAYLFTLKMITQTHNTVCDILECMNESSKPLLSLMMFCIIANIFYDCTILIEFGIKPKIIGGIESTPYIYTMHFFFAAISAAQATAVAYVGEALEEEGQETSRICFSFLHKLPMDFKTPTDLLIERELNLLLDQSKTKRVCIYAGGFVSINWGILGSIASIVATYSVVIIQFLTK